MKLYTATSPTEAHILCEWLKLENIRCEVRGEGLFSLQGELPFGHDTEPYIWLFEPKQAQQALLLIKQYQAQPNNAQDWTCPSCGEHNEGQFALCWQCGASTA